jgi:hypothetical protein
MAAKSALMNSGEFACSWVIWNTSTRDIAAVGGMTGGTEPPVEEELEEEEKNGPDGAIRAVEDDSS